MMQIYVNELRLVVERSTPALLALSEANTARHPAPGKGSPREVLGHLIDSASNNHQRFVRAQFQDPPAPNPGAVCGARVRRIR